jgi:hypothetical protein
MLVGCTGLRAERYLTFRAPAVPEDASRGGLPHRRDKRPLLTRNLKRAKTMTVYNSVGLKRADCTGEEYAFLRSIV